MAVRSQTCCFTGHRNLPSRILPALSAELDRTVRTLTADGFRYFLTGGARGFDTLAAETVLRLRQEFPHIRLILVLPCRNQTRGWKPDDVRRYEAVMEQADQVVLRAARTQPSVCVTGTATWWTTAASARHTVPAPSAVQRTR